MMVGGASVCVRDREDGGGGTAQLRACVYVGGGGMHVCMWEVVVCMCVCGRWCMDVSVKGYDEKGE